MIQAVEDGNTGDPKMRPFHSSKMVTRETARTDRKMHMAILGCPLGAVGEGAAFPPLVLEAGGLGVTSGSGG